MASKEERSRSNRIGGLTLYALRGGDAISAPARKTWLAGFEARADPDHALDPVMRAQRAAELRRAHMLELSRRAAQKKRQTASARN
jgi:hypothetical protein